MGLTLEKAGFETLEGWIADGEEVGKGWAEKKWEDIDFVENVYKPYVQRSVHAMKHASKFVRTHHSTGFYLINSKPQK
jgi:hypothetical protein